MAASRGATDSAALLEEFAEMCTKAAEEVATAKSTVPGKPAVPVELSWEPGKDGCVWLHCPLDGLRSSHTWNGGPRVKGWAKSGSIELQCPKCVGRREDYPDEAAYEAARRAYTEKVKRAIRWTQDGVTHAAFKTIILRSHLYFDRDFKRAVRRDKVRFEDGRKEKGNTNPWRWRSADIAQDGTVGTFGPMRAESWLAQHYPEHDKLYDALCWYGLDLFLDPGAAGALTAATCQLKVEYRVVWVEGEKDADTFNALMEAAGKTGIWATCLCHPNPSKLASHHARLIDGRDLVVVGDADEPGRQAAENATNLAWPHARSIKLVRDQLGLLGTDPEKDLTDWVVRRVGLPPGPADDKLTVHQAWLDWLAKAPTAGAVADELLDLFASTAPLAEPIGRPTEWRTGLISTQKGSPKADSSHNAKRVWTMHPALKGRVRTNLRSGEVEVVDPPWGGALTIGARRAALSCSDWLEQTEVLSLSTRVLEDMLALDHVAPLHNPLDHMLATAWDGVPRIDALFTRYVPLNVEPEIAVALARITVGDLVRKMRNELVGQRLLVGIETDMGLDLAGALMGRHGFQHRGRIGDRQVGQFARQEAMLVQLSMEPVANRQAALASLPCIFAADTMVDGRRLSSPLFLAVGEDPKDTRTAAKVDDRCFLYELAGRPLIEVLRDDAAVMVAEGVSKLDELSTLAVPSKTRTITLDAKRELEGLNLMATCLWLYVTREFVGVDMYSPRAMSAAPKRGEVLRHVVRSQFLDVMRAMLADEYREHSARERAFNHLCRAFGWSGDKTSGPRVGITASIAAKISVDIGRKDKSTLIGVLITDERLGQLEHHLFPDVDSPPPPKGGGGAGTESTSESPVDGFIAFTDGLPSSEAAESLEFIGLLEGYVPRGEKQDRIATPRAHPHDDSKNKKGETGRRWRDGDEAVEVARGILAQPGVCSIDFETWPGDPRWFADDVAARALRGSKGDARQRALHEAAAGNRAKQRRACTLQLHHESGDEVFVRLQPGDDDAPRARQLQAIFDGCRAGLVAHNAQFETEVLAKHGVWIGVDCTLIAAKCLHLVAVPQDAPQPVEYSLASLVQRELGRTRDKTIRARDWRDEAALDDEAVEYGLQDARDALELWQLYSAKLRAGGLWDGYEVMARSLLPTAAINLHGLALDAGAHAELIGRMEAEAKRLEVVLDSVCLGSIDNHGSTQQVSTWIMEEVLQVPIKPPAEPKLVGLIDHLRSKGGLRPDAGGELGALDLGKLVRLDGALSLEHATLEAWEAGYIGHDLSTFGDERPGEHDLLAALDRERFGDRVLTVEDGERWRDHLAQKDHFDRLHEDDPYRLSHFCIRLHAETGGAVKGWRTTKTGHLAITKGSKLRKAEQLREAFPMVSRYLVVHAQWTKAMKLIDGFGASLRRWQDDDGMVRGQHQAFRAWTGRQSCVEPNLQNQPREEEFRALWVARPGRKLVVADYDQMELRLLAIVTGDERLMAVYREGRDVHQETADITGLPRKNAKNVNFAMAYGSGAAGLCENFGFSLDEAHAVLERVLGAYAGLARYRERAPAEAAAQGFIAIRPRRRVAYLADSPGTTAINAPIQGGAASVQMRALRLVHDALVERARQDVGSRAMETPRLDGDEHRLVDIPDACGRAPGAPRTRETTFDVLLAASVHDEVILDSSEACAAEASELLIDCMVRALLEIYPEAGGMGLARLTAATICDRWSEKQ